MSPTWRNPRGVFCYWFIIVVLRILRYNVSTMAGRPPKLENVEMLQSAFDEWKQEFVVGYTRYGEVPDIEGFCDHLGAWRDLLIDYEKKPEFSHTIKQIKNWIYSRKKQLAFTGKMPAAVFIFDAKNNAGYTDQQQLDHTTNGKDLPTPILGGSSVHRDDSDQ